MILQQGSPCKKKTFLNLLSAFVAFANKHLKATDLVSKILMDGEISFEELTFELMESFFLFEPFGNENPQPIFYADVNQNWYPKVVGGFHLKNVPRAKMEEC